MNTIKEFARRCPPENLPEHAERLLEDADCCMRLEFARRCPPDRLPDFAERLLGDADRDVRYEFAWRCPEARLAEFADKLLADPSFSVRWQFAARCPPDRLAEFADRILADAKRLCAASSFAAARRTVCRILPSGCSATQTVTCGTSSRPAARRIGWRNSRIG